MPLKNNRSFFSIWKQNFWKLIVANMLLVITNFPFLWLGFWLTNFILQNLFPENSLTGVFQLLVSQGFGKQLAYEAASYQQMFWQTIFMIVFIGFGTILFIPLQMAFARFYQTLIHSDLFFWKEDAWGILKGNFSRGIIHTLINFAIPLICTISLHFYLLIVPSSIVKTIIISINFLIMLFLLMMQPILQVLYLNYSRIGWGRLFKLSIILVAAQLPANLVGLLFKMFLLLVIPLSFFFFLSQYALMVGLLLGCFLIIAPSQLYALMRAEMVVNRYNLDQLLEHL